MPNNIIMADPKGGDYWGALKALMMGQDVYVPAMDGVTNVPRSMFRNRTNLKGFDFSNITSMAGNAFDESGLTDVTIQNEVRNAGGGEFDGCQSLETITAVGGMKFGNYCVRNCSALRAIDAWHTFTINVTTMTNTQALKVMVIRNTNSVVKINGAFHATCGMLDGGKVYVPTSLKADYITDSSWAQYASMIEAIEGSYYETHYANGDPIPTGG